VVEVSSRISLPKESHCFAAEVERNSSATNQGLCFRGMWLAEGNPSLGSWSALLQDKREKRIPLLQTGELVAKVNNSRGSLFQSYVVQRLSS
jgi:hypothetical protein